MRRYIFTDRERRLLESWIEAGEENQETENILSWIRQGFPRMAEDVELWLQTIKAMQRRRRWRAYRTRSSEFGSASLRAESALTRLRRGAGTSAA